eukprot:gnl/TRDRNA2_/TRDRNA2_58168_c0_seq1.p1 gnl/TRDRNA2_/TRDRNA2_58168_c0~~gnl/TRDRNA2_/TRDRNA2_58168_c0_seq1.p1  ORF type:complete len:529 (+),score=84.83 gnl/TRDRNA2_/TRDRNA2_58168_c0_seq1:108-1589(+)
MCAEIAEQIKQAKFMTLCSRADEFFSQFADQTSKDIVYITNTEDENDVGHGLAFQHDYFPPVRVGLKTVMFSESQSITDLTYRLHLAATILNALVRYDGNLTLDMSTRERMHAIGTALEMPKLRDAILFPTSVDGAHGMQETCNSEISPWGGSSAGGSSQELPEEDDSNAEVPKGRKCSKANSAVSARSFRYRIDTPCSSVASSQQRFTEPEQTIVFFDWDDTVFPTTELFDRWKLPSRPERWADMEISAEQEALLESWRIALKDYLTTVCSLTCRCCIVTASRRPWVEKCTEKFAPDLQPLFRSSSGPRVIHAREMEQSKIREVKFGDAVHGAYTHEEVDERVTEAKFMAMRKETIEFYSQYPGQSWKNIICVGDAGYEYDAAHELVFTRESKKKERIRLKTIMVPRGQTIAEMSYRLRLATIVFRAYVNYDGDINLDMNNPESLQSISKELNMPQLYKAIQLDADGEIDDDEDEEDTLLLVAAFQRQLSDL